MVDVELNEELTQYELQKRRLNVFWKELTKEFRQKAVRNRTKDVCSSLSTKYCYNRLSFQKLCQFNDKASRYVDDQIYQLNQEFTDKNKRKALQAIKNSLGNDLLKKSTQWTKIKRKIFRIPCLTDLSVPLISQGSWFILLWNLVCGLIDSSQLFILPLKVCFEVSFRNSDHNTSLFYVIPLLFVILNSLVKLNTTYFEVTPKQNVGEYDSGS